MFGEGPATARLRLVGEQPGDAEDLAGRPLVGPAGRILDQALDEAGIDRKEVYVTNTVKHYKWEPRGKRRLHAKPSAREVAACGPWLAAEIAAVRPALVVCLGATAAQALFGGGFRVTRQRGQPLRLPPRWWPWDGDRGNGGWALATVHPSSLLRMPDPAARHAETARFVADLQVAARWRAAP